MKTFSITKDQAETYLKSGYTHMVHYETFSKVFTCKVESRFPICRDDKHSVQGLLKNGYENIRISDLKDFL